MYFTLLLVNVLIFCVFSEDDGNVSYVTEDKTAHISDADNDLIYELFQGVRKALTHINNDIPFLIKVAEDGPMKQSNTSVEEEHQKLLKRKKNNKLLIEILQKKINANNSLIIKEELLHLTRDLSTLTVNNFHRSENYKELPPLRCISCSTLETLDCNSPQGKDLLSVTCSSSKDICYSSHTPFGIVERGCIDVITYKNIYVCKCNLCNYVPISDMPFLFPKKLKWIEDVLKISHRRQLQRTVFTQMACLTCEVNITKEVNDMFEDAYCLEGNINKLPVEICKEDEVCAVRTIRDQGYIWRGCVRAPLYNYWWSFCDTNMCNSEPLATIYDVTMEV